MHQASQIELELTRRNAVLAAIGYAATRIVNAPDWRTAIPELLERLGLATNVSRAFLCEMYRSQAGAMLQSCRFMWSANGVAPIAKERLRDIPILESADSEIGRLHSRRSRGEVVQLTRSQAGGDGLSLLEEFGVLSLLYVPILIDGAYWGCLGFDDCLQERVWDDVESDLLRTAASLIAAGVKRSHADARLRERDQLLTGAQRIAQLGIWVLDFETNTVEWSDEGWRIFGHETNSATWSHEENLGRIHPEDRALVAEMDAQARDHGQAFEMEYRIRRSDGEVRVLRERADVVRDAAGRPIRLLGIVHDITEMKNNELRLRESEERYALAARGAGVGLWDWKLKSKQAYFSPRMHELLCVPTGGLGNSIDQFFDRLVPDDRHRLKQQLDNLFAKNRRRVELEVRARIGEDQVRWFQIRGLIVYEGPEPVRLVGSLLDVTDRKRAVEEIARQREALYKNEKMAMLGSLLAGVAHELNNPLSVVIGQVALLEETVRDPSVLRRVERIQKATERCARIVRTFLAMARQRDFQTAPVNVNNVIETVLEMLAFQLRSAEIQVELDIAAEVPALMGDADQLHQLLTNLIVNACQALSSSPLPRVIRIATRLTAGCRLQLTVCDNGPGVPPEIRRRIFDPFFTTKRAGEGTGIGLSLCSSIVRAHGGSIVASESMGGGAAFVVDLPVRVAGGSLEDAPDAGVSGRVGRRVLIIEDESDIAHMLSEILNSYGHEASITVDGVAGLESALSRRYDAILSDIRLPKIDGIDVYRELKRRRPGLVNRLAFITGDTLSTDIQAFLSESGALCLEKPFMPADVLSIVSHLASQPGVSDE